MLEVVESIRRKAHLFQTLVFIGDFHTATELTSRWLTEDPGHPRLTVMLSALKGPEFRVPSEGDPRALQYVAELAQRRAARVRSVRVVEPLALKTQTCKLVELSWSALLASVTNAIEACNKGKYVSAFIVPLLGRS